MAAFTAGLAYDTAMLMLINCFPRVSAIRSVLDTPAGVLHMTLLSDTHAENSVVVIPVPVFTDPSYWRNLTPMTVVWSFPANFKFGFPACDTET
jgi:hypothetical protein